MTTYTSTGTIKRLEISSGDSGVRMFFVPDCHHSVRHDDALYAVFIAPKKFSPNKLGILAVKCDPKEGYCFKERYLSSELQPAIEQAAINQCKVDIRIDVPEDASIDNGLFVGITIPAKRDK